MKFWVVAKEGLLGKEVCGYFEERGIAFIGSAHSEADILDPKSIKSFFETHTPTHIVNCAAYVNVDEAEKKGKEDAFKLNVMGPKNLRELSEKQGARLIHIGTDYVFDGKKRDEYVENDSTGPINEYGRTKLEGEIEVLKYEKAVCIRTASLYGLGKPGIISHMIDSLKEKEIVQHIMDQISSPTYTKDLAEAIFAVRDQKGVFHFANKGGVSRYGLLVHIWHLAKELGIDIRCKEVNSVTQKDCKRAAIRPERSVLSSKKIEVFLEKPVRTWEEALREYMSCYVNK